MKMSRLQGCLLAFLVVFLFCSLFLNIGLIVALVGGNDEQFGARREPVYEEEFVEGGSPGKEKIAVIDLEGLISSAETSQFTGSMVDEVAGKLKQAREDDRVRSIILKIDSPGGEVNASDILYHEIKKTREKKPVVIYMESLAASGGFYAAMGGSYIMANDLTLTGSIGVILQTINYKDLIDKIGIKAVTFKSGKFKDLLNGGRVMTPEEQQLVQGMIDETYGKFVGIVARERKLDEKMLRRDVADGRILSGLQAKNDKLIDGLGYFEDAISKAKELGKTKNPRVVRYTSPFNWSRYLRMLGRSEVKADAIQLQIGPRSLQLESGKLYFLSPHLFSQF
jgi:protease-4